MRWLGEPSPLIRKVIFLFFEMAKLLDRPCSFSSLLYCLFLREASALHQPPSAVSDDKMQAVWQSAACGRYAASIPLGKILRKRCAIDKHFHFLHGRELQRCLLDLRLHARAVHTPPVTSRPAKLSRATARRMETLPASAPTDATRYTAQVRSHSSWGAVAIPRSGLHGGRVGRSARVTAATLSSQPIFLPERPASSPAIRNTFTSCAPAALPVDMVADSRKCKPVAVNRGRRVEQYCDAAKPDKPSLRHVTAPSYDHSELIAER